MEDAHNFEILLGNVLGEAPSEKALSASSNDCHTSGGEELSEPPEETGTLSPDLIAISVQVSDLSLPSIPAVVFQAIWKKTEELIKTRRKIVNCPGNPKGRMVESRREARPHLVKEMAGGKITCDCPNYSSLQVCAHAVAGAEQMGCLRKFVDWRERRASHIPNFTKVVMSDTPKGAGVKSGRANARRRGGSTRKTTAYEREEERSSLSCSASSSTSPPEMIQSIVYRNLSQ